MVEVSAALKAETRVVNKSRLPIPCNAHLSKAKFYMTVLVFTSRLRHQSLLCMVEICAAPKFETRVVNKLCLCLSTHCKAHLDKTNLYMILLVFTRRLRDQILLYMVELCTKPMTLRLEV